MENQLGSNIRAVREVLGCTQEQLAARLDTAVPTVSLIESGKRFPSFPMLVRIRRALGCEWPVLMRGIE